MANIHWGNASRAGGELPVVSEWTKPGDPPGNPDATLVDPAGFDLHPYYAAIDAAKAEHVKRVGGGCVSLVSLESEELIRRGWSAHFDPRRHRVAPQRYELHDWSRALEELRRIAAERSLKVQEPPLGYTLSTARDAAKENGNEWYFSIQDFDMAVLTGKLVVTSGYVQAHYREPGSPDTLQALEIELRLEEHTRLESWCALDHGVLYMDGEFVTRDLTRAKRYFEAAHAAGETKASFYLGTMYQQGAGVVQDLERARQCWEAACAGTGDDLVAQAASNLGSMYRLGDGVAVDLPRARQLYERALAAGDVQAATNLGSMYAQGEGVAQDFERARGYFETAHNAGDGEASYNLAYMHEEGKGVPVDLGRARQYYEAARAAGDEDAAAKLRGWQRAHGNGYACGGAACLRPGAMVRKLRAVAGHAWRRMCGERRERGSPASLASLSSTLMSETEGAGTGTEVEATRA